MSPHKLLTHNFRGLILPLIYNSIHPDSTMTPSPVRIAPAFKKPKDLQQSFHVNEDDLSIFDLLEDTEEKNILDVTSHSLPMRSRGVAKKASFSSVPSRKPQRRGSVASTASATSFSSSSGHSRSSLRRSKSHRSSKTKCTILVEPQMENLTL
jgi:hypothetical protein